MLFSRVLDLDKTENPIYDWASSWWTLKWTEEIINLETEADGIPVVLASTLQPAAGRWRLKWAEEIIDLKTEACDRSVVLASTFQPAAGYSWQILNCCTIREEQYWEYHSMS